MIDALRVILAHTLAGALALPAAALAQEASQALGERLRGRVQQRASAPAATPLPAGRHALTVRHDGLARQVIVHVPAGLDPGRGAPLVLAFHGGGGHAEYMADDERYGLTTTADREGFVVVFPNGYSRWPRGRLATWNAGSCCGDARERGVDDVGFVRAVIDEVATRVPIDRARIFATGMSNGGMLVHRLACEMADVVRAVAAVAGTDGTTDCRPARPVSVLHIHARDDTHVLFDGGAGPDAFRDPGKVTDFVSVPQTMQRWVQRNRCDATPQRTLEVAGAYCDTWRGCAGGVSVQLCVTDTGGHSWPGASTVRRGKAPASQALSANDVMSEFFRRSAAR
ncbi:alpha/beta hydrolase family esterase [Azohydromonas sediminis]|uniref:extracellular catalytic domain type 1 short-chain-length polyhydroxyalkanoate depolymerase n=1 Tax=Azohydromonas sediminis TaxID=2259674 RepID=UPI000E64A658|nr:PHB depolymerase family esterase [Azohydromonas sediminis]